MNRVILITLDGVGIGALDDAEAYGDSGANTLQHVAAAVSHLSLPHLCALGLGRLIDFPGAERSAVAGAYGQMLEKSAGKDTTTGHWEICGIIQTDPFPTWPHGFPDEIIDRFTMATGYRPLGNIAASGTDILRQLGEEHIKTGEPIVYTSSDSVFQIAAHEEVIPPEKLYELCRVTRRILDPYRIGRVIARPFRGTDRENFQRTSNRHDFSMPPGEPTLLDRLQEKRIPVHAIGKISDIFAGRGISSSCLTKDNRDGMSATLAALEACPHGLIFTNLVDFDMLYGHRLDPAGFAAALREFDVFLPTLQRAMRDDDLLIITADHGCDPTTPGTDHTRESVPLLCWHPSLRQDVALGVRQSFADVAATIADIFSVKIGHGKSFADSLQINFNGREGFCG